jgi:malic enzyme
VEDRLKEELNIPVFHDDQHGTAIVVLAGMINAIKITERDLNKMKIVVSGAGAAGTAIMRLLHEYAPEANILAVDSQGIVSADRPNLASEKQLLLHFTNRDNIKGSLESAVKGADAFIGVSKPDLLKREMVRSMAPKPIIFALANPIPEIQPHEAKEAGASVVATGRSDLPNQVNNSLVFPGIFRGALDNKVSHITDEHKVAAAKVLAELVTNPSPDHIIPGPFTPGIVEKIASVIK